MSWTLTSLCVRHAKKMRTGLLITKMSTSANEKKINVNGQTINYLISGNGEKVVLCFPGALGTIWSDFKPQIEEFDKQKFTTVAWDPPGYGLSRPPSRKFTSDFYENDAKIAHNFMKALKFQKYSLLGWSDGGISSMILAALYPDSIEKLVIFGANAYVKPEEIQSYEKIRDVSKWSDKMKAPLIKMYGEDGLQKMWNDWCDAMQQIHKQEGDICTELLGLIKSPTLILHGDKDPMVLEEHPEYLCKKIKNARLYRFPDGKHNIHLRYAKEFNKTVCDFILNESKL